MIEPSKHDEKNLKPIISLRHLYFLFTDIIDELEKEKQEAGEYTASVGYTIHNIQQKIEKQLEENIETIKEDL